MVPAPTGQVEIFSSQTQSRKDIEISSEISNLQSEIHKPHPSYPSHHSPATLRIDLDPIH
jgi:hypothetical protein